VSLAKLLVARRTGLMAAAMILSAFAGQAQAANLTLNYVSGQIANNSNFTSPTTVTLSGPNPTVTLLPGQFFRFGVAASVTNNPNPAAGGAWDQDNVDNNGGTALPTTLGVAQLFFRFSTTSGSASIAAPINNGAGRSTATISSAPGFALTDSGDINGGVVGGSFPLGGGFISATAFETNKIGAFSSNATFFSNLRYSAVAAGTTTLTPNVTNWSFWQYVAGGTDPNIAPTYGVRVNNTGSISDSLITANFNPITITVVPEPGTAAVAGSMGVLGLLRRRKTR
jgi:hypothetical protein